MRHTGSGRGIAAGILAMLGVSLLLSCSNSDDEVLKALSKKPSFTPVTERPEAADARSEVGHLEGDLILWSFNRSAIVRVFDRASRSCWPSDLPEGHDADATLAALIELVVRIPEGLRSSLTWDQGTEMARWADLPATVGIDVFFADPPLVNRRNHLH